ncbi:MAG: hypothetical protein ABIT38_09055, partial [Gemmatimonadaceae bacterium]
MSSILGRRIAQKIARSTRGVGTPFGRLNSRPRMKIGRQLQLIWRGGAVAALIAIPGMLTAQQREPFPG